MEERKLEVKSWPTISVSISDTMRDRLDYIQNALGLKSRSAVIGVAINQVYDELVAQAHSRLKKNK